MAGDEAKIRVRLDFGGADGDLERLYGKMGSPPTVSLGGAGGGLGFRGGVGTGFGIGAGMGLARGAFDAVFGERAREGWSGMAKPFGTLQDDFGRFLFGETGPTNRAGERATAQVKEQLGLAFGFGAANKNDVRSLWDTYMQIELPKARGEQAIQDLGRKFEAEAIGAAIADGRGGVLGDLVKAMAELTAVMKDARSHP